jgi:hypothetical protein
MTTTLSEDVRVRRIASLTTAAPAISRLTVSRGRA